MAFRSVLSGTAALLLPICALIFALTPTLVQDVLGPDWSGTVPIIRILTLVTAIDLFGEVTAPLFKGLGQPSRVTIVETAQSLMLIGFVLVFVGSYGLIGAAIAWLPAVIIARIISVFFVKRLLKRPFAGISKPMATIGLTSVGGALVAAGIDQIVPGFIGFVLAAGMGIVVTGLLLWVLDRRFELGFIRSLALFFPQILALPGFSHVGKQTQQV